MINRKQNEVKRELFIKATSSCDQISFQSFFLSAALSGGLGQIEASVLALYSDAGTVRIHYQHVNALDRCLRAMFNALPVEQTIE